MPAVPGMRPPMKAMTVVPFGMEEGAGHQFLNRQFSLRIGERAQFRLFQSAERKNDAAGEMLDQIVPELEEVPAVEVTLPGEAGETVTVTLESLVTETGMLELWFVAKDARRWKLEFNVRPGRRPTLQDGASGTGGFVIGNFLRGAIDAGGDAGRPDVGVSIHSGGYRKN